MTLRTDSIYGHSEPFGWYTYCRTFCLWGLALLTPFGVNNFMIGLMIIFNMRLHS